MTISRLASSCLLTAAVVSSVSFPALAQTSPSGWVEASPQEKETMRSLTRRGAPAPVSSRASSQNNTKSGATASTTSGGNDTPATDSTNTGADLVRKGGDKRPIQVGVTHSEQLPALPSGLRVGATFDQRALKAGTDNLDWYKIPNWLEGKWGRNEETVLSTYYYDSGQQNNEPRTIAETEYADFGAQYDKSHNVWHARLANNGVADCGSYLSIAFIRKQEPLVVSDQKVVIRDLFVELEVNKETGVIMKSDQAESITRYVPVQDGLLKTTMSVKVFAEDGSPVRLQKNVAYDKRISAFSAVDKYKNADIKTSFQNFLRSNGYPDLVPN